MKPSRLLYFSSLFFSFCNTTDTKCERKREVGHHILFKQEFYPKIVPFHLQVGFRMQDSDPIAKAAAEPTVVAALRIEIMELSDRKLRFRLMHANPALANGLRRAILDDVPSLAIDVVEFHSNTTVLNDDLLAHRIGSIPLNSRTVDRFCAPNDCNCEDGCSRCQTTFKLDVRNDSDETKTVMSGNLLTAVGTVRPISSEVAIALLGKNQEISLTARASRGTGKQNAKWNPTTVAAYRAAAKITLNQTLLNRFTPTEKQKVVDCCPSRVLEIENVTGAVRVGQLDRCTQCLDCVECAAQILDERDQALISKTSADAKIPGVDAKAQVSSMVADAKAKVVNHYEDNLRRRQNAPILVDERKDEFMFVVETNGALAPEDVMRRAIDALTTRLLELRTAATAARPILFDPPVSADAATASAAKPAPSTATAMQTD
jgi:DNA-directed RNA polymerase alpha subunit